jgi:RND family efflux transporter MFP subunit
MKSWHYLTCAAVLIVGLTFGVVLYLRPNGPRPQTARSQEPAPQEVSTASQYENELQPGTIAVDVMQPRKGMDLEVEQPGSVHAFESVNLRPKVSGFLKKLNVDIGDTVKRGQVLAVIDVPELEKQIKHNEASVSRAKASVQQMEARVTSARADRDAAEAAVEQAKAAYQSAEAWVRYRLRVYNRRKKLFDSASIEEALVDEAREKYEASLETDRAAKAAIVTSTANLIAAGAKIKQAEADVVGAQADVRVHQADLEKTQVLLNFASIPAPFDGEVTRRNFFEQDFIRSATEGAAQEPLLTVQRTDKFRIVVRVPDSCVPFLDKGDPAIVRIDSLPGKQFVGTVSRRAGSEDPATRLMHVEIDLPNPTGEIRDGMYGNVKILLDRFADKLSIPLSSVVTPRPGHPAVYLVGADGKAHLTEVRLGKDNGTSVVVLSGLTPDDRVVLNPPSGLHDGAEVEPRVIQPAVAEAP